MSPGSDRAAPRGFIIALLLLPVMQVSANSLSKSNLEHHHQLHNGCDTIHRILNGTDTHHKQDEGFLVDHDQWHNHKDLGSICRSRCCSHQVELELSSKSTHYFIQTLRHHTKSLRSSMVTTAKRYREHIMELSAQSENKTLHIFAQIYGNMAPFATRSISALFDNIRSRLRRVAGEQNLDIETVVHNFFVDLYPVVCHQVLLSEDEGNYQAAALSTKDFHNDYKKCIKHTYESVMPFGEVPRNLARSLQQSFGAAEVFLRSLEQGASVLENVEQLDKSHLGTKCSSHLVKMNYCQECDSNRKVKSCHGYCLNVMRGCLSQFLGGLDRPWASFALAVEQLQHKVRSKEGIESVLRSLDGHLSEAIMQAMQNGPHIEKKVKQLCGSLSMVEELKTTSTTLPLMHQTTDTVIPMDTEMIQFLVTIENSQEFYSNIVNSYCEDNDFQQDDKNCWTGDRIGEYLNTVMPTGISSQKYNPEVPYNSDEFRTNYEVNELGDKLTNLKQSMSIAMTKYSDRQDQEHNEMQSDMAEGSAGWPDADPSDDFAEASGSGHGPAVVIPTSPPGATPIPVDPRDTSIQKVSLAVSLQTWSWQTTMTFLLSAFFMLGR